MTNNMTIWIMVGLFVIYIIIFIVLQNKKKKDFENHQAKLEVFRNKLKRGDKVITLSGIYGKVTSINGTIVSVEISDGVCINMDIQSIMGVLEK